jgi:hypothetical protein
MPQYDIIKATYMGPRQPDHEVIVGRVEGRDPMEAEGEARKLGITGRGYQFLKLREAEPAPKP